MSTKTGVHPSQTIEEVVATKEKGVVMSSPFKSNALIVICNATVPLVTKRRFSTPRWVFNFSSSSLASGPILVSQLDSHILSKYCLYSSKGGKIGRAHV